MIRCIRSRWRWWRELERLEDDVVFLGFDDEMRYAHGIPRHPDYERELKANNRKYFKMRHFAYYRKWRKKHG